MESRGQHHAGLLALAFLAAGASLALLNPNRASAGFMTLTDVALVGVCIIGHRSESQRAPFGCRCRLGALLDGGIEQGSGPFEVGGRRVEGDEGGVDRAEVAGDDRD